LARELASKEGIFVGISAGATLAGALKIAETASPGTNILCMLPDTGERYLSTPLFEAISNDMNEDEIAISCSTPSYRFDVDGSATEEQEEEVGELDAAAMAEVTDTIKQQSDSIVMFALEWCEFCWSVRKIFDKYGVKFESVDLDSVEYMDGERGKKMRKVLERQNNWKTLPQIYIGGEFVGGCTDLFDSINDGRFAQLMAKHRIPYDQSVKVNPYDLLPGWLHPR
jgi:cysteine synthase A